MVKLIVAVVGRLNVEKSALLNELIGQRLSIVEDTPGATRDRIFSDCEWGDHKFSLVGTGGIEPESKGIVLSQMRAQAQLAIDPANVITMVTNLHSGVAATDAEVVAMLQKSGHPIILCMNKYDRVGEPPSESYEFYNLGSGEPAAVSSVHGHDIGDLLDCVVEFFPDETGEEDEGGIIRVVVIKEPNVGRSSLINYVASENRSIISDVADTTRDAIDTEIESESDTSILIDTAGIRRQDKVEDSIERYGILCAEMTIERSDVYMIIIGTTVGFTEQDSKMTGRAHETGKGCVIAANKWDTAEKDNHTINDYCKQLEKDLSFTSYALIIFVSAHMGQRVDKLFETIHHVASMNSMRISTDVLNNILTQATARVQPPTDKGRCLKIYYMIQVSVRPPTFTCFVNSAGLFHFSYQRYLENRIRETFGPEDTPIRMVARGRGDK